MTGQCQQFSYRRYDLSTAILVFGSLFLAASALCTIDTTPSAHYLLNEEEVRVATDENAVGPDEKALIAGHCEKKSQRPHKGALQTRKTCRD